MKHQAGPRLLAVSIFLSPVLFAPACNQPSRICDMVCECEHCNDLVEDSSCERISASQEIAEIYACDGQWTAYADCYEEKGTCNEEEARFSTLEQGSCSSTASSGLSCTDNVDCLNTGIDGARCENMECVYQACNDGNGTPCENSSDCPGGEDKCQSELDDLQECLADASDDPILPFFGFN